MIDLHLHTTASDGRFSPEELVRRAANAGLSVIAVTDHDTMAAVPLAAEAAARHGITCIPGIEVTSVWEQRDVHVLGYFAREDAPALAELIRDMRRARLARARLIVSLLARAGAPLDMSKRFDAAADGGPTIARPEIARALVAERFVSTVAEAFDQFLSEGRPAYVPHRGPTPMDAVAGIVEAGGIASLAHPGPLGRDHLIPKLCDAGLGAIEAYHSSHDEATRQRYVDLAQKCGLAVTGGSDFHGEGMHEGRVLGGVSVPPQAFAQFLEKSITDRGGRLRPRGSMTVFGRSGPASVS